MLKYFLIFATAFSLTACGQTKLTDQNIHAADQLIALTKEQKMDTTYFWKIMDHAFAIAKFDNKLKAQTILDQLIILTPEQIREFEIIFQQMNLKASTWNNLAAHTIIEGGSSDDTFFYFRCWLISLGKYHFDETLRKPDHLADVDIPINKKYGYGEVIFEELIPLSDKAYSIVTGKQTEDNSFPRAFAQTKDLFYDSNIDLKGKEWKDDELPNIAPKLYKKFDKN